MPIEAPQSHAHQRNRSLRLAVIASALAKGASMLCTLAQVPIALHYLGAESYGLWIVLMSIFGLLNFVDFGIGVGMQQKMAEAYAGDDGVRLRRTFLSGCGALAALGLLSLLIGLPVAWWGDWGRWFGLTAPALQAQAPAALAIIIGGFALGLPGNAVVRLGGALQLDRWQAAWNAAGNALTLLVVALAAHYRWGFLPFVAASALLPAFQNLGLWWQLRRRLGWRGPGPGLLPRAEWRGLARASLFFVFPQFSLAVLAWLPALIISLGSGAAAVTAFNLIQRLLGPLGQGQAILLTPLWPAYTEARLRRDFTWLRRAEQRAWRTTLLLTAAIALVCWQADLLIRWWVGPTASQPEPALVWLTGLWSALLMIGRHYIYFLVGLDRLPVLARHAAPGAAGAVAGLAAGGLWGGASAALALGSLGYALLGLPGLVIASRRPRLVASPAL